eukprot:1161012-Pelagomonas_calceolata.AAC.4
MTCSHQTKPAMPLLQQTPCRSCNNKQEQPRGCPLLDQGHGVISNHGRLAAPSQGAAPADPVALLFKAEIKGHCVDRQQCRLGCNPIPCDAGRDLAPTCLNAAASALACPIYTCGKRLKESGWLAVAYIRGRTGMQLQSAAICALVRAQAILRTCEQLWNAPVCALVLLCSLLHLFPQLPKPEPDGVEQERSMHQSRGEEHLGPKRMYPSPVVMDYGDDKKRPTVTPDIYGANVLEPRQECILCRQALASTQGRKGMRPKTKPYSSSGVDLSFLHDFKNVMVADDPGCIQEVGMKVVFIAARVRCVPLPSPGSTGLEPTEFSAYTIAYQLGYQDCLPDHWVSSASYKKQAFATDATMATEWSPAVVMPSFSCTSWPNRPPHPLSLASGRSRSKSMTAAAGTTVCWAGSSGGSDTSSHVSKA